VEEWDSEYTAVKALVSSVPAGIADAVVPDTTQIEQNIENIKQRMSILNDRLQAVAAQKQSLADKASGLAKLEEQRRQLSQESQYYCKLADDLSGKNPLGLRFESWILGVYLEEVTIFASRRLERISDGRYRLLLKTSPGSGRQRYSGLDLEIFDAYTGKKRPCETLSGGETFLASLSLALALTDVVQSKSGGIQLDSLFIDEGFGSLDDAALEKALSILDEIRETRMIGLISHVGELESRISSRIEVIKSQNGSRISIKRN
jgi:exonuclease SbcC